MYDYRAKIENNIPSKFKNLTNHCKRLQIFSTVAEYINEIFTYFDSKFQPNIHETSYMYLIAFNLFIAT